MAAGLGLIATLFSTIASVVFAPSPPSMPALPAPPAPPPPPPAPPAPPTPPPAPPPPPPPAAAPVPELVDTGAVIGPQQMAESQQAKMRDIRRKEMAASAISPTALSTRKTSVKTLLGE